MIISQKTYIKYNFIFKNIIISDKKFDYNLMVSNPIRIVTCLHDGYKFMNKSNSSVLIANSGSLPYYHYFYKNQMLQSVCNMQCNISQKNTNVLYYDYDGDGNVMYYSNGLIYDRNKIHIAILRSDLGINVLFNRSSDNIVIDTFKKMIKNMLDSNYGYVDFVLRNLKIIMCSECNISDIIRTIY